MEKLYTTYRDVAAIFLVYIREAHPDSVLKTVVDGDARLLKIGQTASFEARAANAEKCVATLKLSIPTLVDGEDNRVNSLYGAWPDRLYVIGKDGKIAYQGGPGPGGFRVPEVGEWLRKYAARE